MDEADMFLDTEGSTLEYVAGTEYDDFASSSIGVFIIGQYDGVMTDSDIDTDSDDPPEEEEKGEPEKHS